MKNYIKIISIQKVEFADWYVFATDENKHSYYVPRYKCLGTTILPNLQSYYIPEYDRLCRISFSTLQSYLLKDGYLMAIVNDKGSLQYLGTKTAVIKLKMEELKKI